MMELSFLSEILKGVWLMDKTFEPMLEQFIVSHLKASTVEHLASVAIDNPAKKSKVMAYGLRSKSAYRMDSPVPNEPYVGIIPIEGVVMKSDTWYTIGTATLQNMMKYNEQDPNCCGHLLCIDSPGGSSANTETFARFIKDEIQKPVVAHVSSMCASAAYYIGCAADELWCSQADDSVGSIGVFCTLYDFSKYLADNGIAKHEIYATQSGQKNDSVKKAFAGDYKAIQTEYLDPVAEQFLQTVKDMRPNLTDKNALEGKLYAAKNAPTGMIDGVMKFNDALARVTALADKMKKN
jgi:protease-4